MNEIAHIRILVQRISERLKRQRNEDIIAPDTARQSSKINEPEMVESGEPRQVIKSKSGWNNPETDIDARGYQISRRREYPSNQLERGNNCRYRESNREDWYGDQNHNWDSPSDECRPYRDRGNRRSRRWHRPFDDSSSDSDYSHQQRNASHCGNRNCGTWIHPYEHSEIENIERCESRHRQRRGMRPMAVKDWKLCFSGDPKTAGKHDVNIHQFVNRVQDYSKNADMSPQDALQIVPHLLTGSASDWYDSEGRYCRTWKSFVKQLRAHFLPLSSDYELIVEANQRKQGKIEPVAQYVSAMRLIFNAMCRPMDSTMQLFLVRQNLHPSLCGIVASHCPKSINDILRIAKEIECAKSTITEYEINTHQIGDKNARVNSNHEQTSSPASSAL